MNPLMITILFGVLLAAPVRASDRLWTVDEVHQHAWQLHGKVITVRGWLPKCQRLDCSLFGSKSDAAKFSDAPAEHRLLEIGGDAAFDSAVRGKLPAEIVLRARVNATCIRPRVTTDSKGNQLITVCADRVDDLQPLQLIKLKRAVQDAAGIGK